MVPSAARDPVQPATSAGSGVSKPSPGPRRTLARTLRLVADPTRLQLLSMINGSPGQEVTVES